MFALSKKSCFSVFFTYHSLGYTARPPFPETLTFCPAPAVCGAVPQLPSLASWATAPLFLALPGALRLSQPHVRGASSPRPGVSAGVFSWSLPSTRGWSGGSASCFPSDSAVLRVRVRVSCWERVCCQPRSL